MAELTQPATLTGWLMIGPSGGLRKELQAAEEGCMMLDRSEGLRHMTMSANRLTLEFR